MKALILAIAFIPIIPLIARLVELAVRSAESLGMLVNIYAKNGRCGCTY